MKFPHVCLLIALVAAVSGTAAGSGIGPDFSVLPRDIPDGHPGGVVSTLSLAGGDVIDDLDVSLDIDHDWTGDLVVTLQSPTGTRVTLVDRPGFDGSAGYGCRFGGLQARLDDEALVALEDQCADDLGGTIPSIAGTLRPAEPLTAFDGEPASGTWLLRVSDWADENDGRLMSWQLHFECSDLDVDLQATLSADRARATPGDTVILTLGIVNAGTAPASGVETAYELPEGLEAEWAEPGALDRGWLVTQRHGPLEPGEVTEAQLAVTVTDGPWGLRKVIVTVDGLENDSHPRDNQATAGIHVGPMQNLPAHWETGRGEVSR